MTERSFLRLRRIALSACLCAFGLAQNGTASVKVPDVPIHTLLLANGLEVVMAREGRAPVVAVEVWYHVGSKDERPGMNGFAHLFEHLMFDGTRNLAPDEFSNYIVRDGGEDNAYTTVDATVFWETIPTADLPVALWLEADRMRDLRINQSIFDKERSVVEAERQQHFGNEPYGDVMQTLYAHAFTVSPYRHMPIGSVQDLDRATLSEVQAFHDTYYVPNNATLVLAGNFGEKQAAGWIERDFGSIKGSSRAIPRNYPKEPPQTSERLVRLYNDVALPAFVEGYHIPADGTRDSYPLRLAAKILGEGESAWLFRTLVYKRQMAMEVDSEGDFTEEPNLFFVMAVMNPGFTPEQGEAEVSRVLNRLKRGDIPARVLERAKNETLRDLILQRDSPHRCAEALGYDAVVLQDPYLYNAVVSRFAQVTVGDIQRVARRYFVRRNMTLVEVYPKVAAGQTMRKISVVVH